MVEIGDNFAISLNILKAKMKIATSIKITITMIASRCEVDAELRLLTKKLINITIIVYHPFEHVSLVFAVC
jgi:hypothetical protein